MMFVFQHKQVDEKIIYCCACQRNSGKFFGQSDTCNVTKLVFHFLKNNNINQILLYLDIDDNTMIFFQSSYNTMILQPDTSTVFYWMGSTDNLMKNNKKQAFVSKGISIN